MSQVDSRYTTNLSRRSTLVADAGVAALPAATLAKGEGEPDPIFAVIKAHDAAMRNESACNMWQSILEGRLPSGQHTWRVGSSDEPPENSTDAPEWIASQLALGEANDRRKKSILTLLTTPPTTLAGAAALLAYLGTNEHPRDTKDRDKPMLFVFSDYRYDEIKAAALAFPKTMALALRGLRAMASLHA